MEIFYFLKEISPTFMWKWEGCMQWMMLWVSYNCAKLLRKRILNFNMHIQLMKRVGWSIFFGRLLLVDQYQKYGDVVVFYTTYKVNAYDMSFGIFVGINNHGKTILIGCALLRNETTSAFQWLMKVRKLFNYLASLCNYFSILFD